MKKPVFLFILLFASIYAFSQKDIYMKPLISAGFMLEPHKQMIDSPGTFKFSTLSLKGSLPLFNKLPDTLKFRNKFFQLNLVGSFAYSIPDISYISNRHKFYNASLGINSMYFLMPKSYLLAQFHISFAEDDYLVSNPVYRYSGFFIYHRKISPKWGYTAGLVYSYSDAVAYSNTGGYGLLLPVLGITNKINDKTFLNINLPVNISLVYKPDKATFITFYMKPYGSSYRFSTSDIKNVAGLDSTVPSIKFIKREFQAGISLFYDAPSRVSFEARTGTNFARHLTLKDDKTYFQTGIQPCIFVSMNIIFKPTKSKKETRKQSIENKNMEDILEDISPDEIE